MAYKINNDCINCGACRATCPVGAITVVEGRHMIETAACVDCGSCAVCCPVGAPRPDSSLS
ncbi:MAG: 4Fe-4S binding protein [Oscillospiraceae bacterium]|jgi:ferredoxin|nr:4Fe-4S binding protein [Oscillospiraceae bacterium]